MEVLVELNMKTCPGVTAKYSGYGLPPIAVAAAGYPVVRPVIIMPMPPAEEATVPVPEPAVVSLTFPHPPI